MCSMNKEPLGNGFTVNVSDIHRFNTDTIILADFAMPKKHENVIDIGTGCGTMPIIWCREEAGKHITAVDIQTDACELLKSSIADNNLQDKINVINDDIMNLNSSSYVGAFDLAVCNPPYKPAGTGIVNNNIGKTTARHEQNITIDDIALCANRLLRFGGRFCLCQRPERLSDVISAFRNADIEPKRLRFVQQRLYKAPKLFLIEGKRGAQKSGLVVLPTLFIEDINSNDFSDEMKKIYGIYKYN